MGSYDDVLQHYARPKDSLKRRASLFLIANLKYHYGYYGGDIDQARRAFSVIDTLSYTREALDESIKNAVLDSINTLNRINVMAPGKEIRDDKIVSSAYLISNIELAYKAWMSSPWKKEVRFADFCEYILPYRIRDEQVQSWRHKANLVYSKFLINAPNPKDLRSTYEYIKGNVEAQTKLSGYFGTRYPYTQNFSDALQGKIGACETTTSLGVAIMRSVGIPAALDHVPHWGNNSNSNHYWIRLIEKAKSTIRFSNINEPVNTWGIVDFASDYSKDHHHFGVEEAPKGMYIQYIKTIPKVYRHQFSPDPILKDINEDTPDAFIAPFFKTAGLKDVTSEYMGTSTRLLEIAEKFRRNKVVYLCVFDNKGWQPVAVAQIDHDNVLFDQVGNYVVYLPAVYESGNLTPIDNPFFLDSLNIIRELKPADRKIKNVKLLRKSPLYSYTAYHTEALKGGYFEGANTSDFKKAELLYQIDNFPFYMNEVRIKGPTQVSLCKVRGARRSTF
jgi:hypothetical protein